MLHVVQLGVQPLNSDAGSVRRRSGVDRHRRPACGLGLVRTCVSDNCLLVPPIQCVFGPFLVVEQIHDVLEEDVSVEVPIMDRPGLLRV